MRTTRLIAVGALLLAVPVAAAAQSKDARVAVSGAAGVASDFYGDFIAPEWQIAVRAAVARPLVLEGFFDQWRHGSEEVRTDLTLRGPSGVIIGQIGRLETITTHTTRTVGLNALARGFAGRASVTGGGGIGYFFYHRRSEQIVTDCESSSPAVCQNSESTHEWQSFSVQGLAGVDVPIGPVIAAFGQFKVVTPVRDVTASHFSTTGGIRVKIW